MIRPFLVLCLVAAPPALPAVAAQPSPVVTAEETPAAVTPPAEPVQIAPYDTRLVRLSEILGSVHYLRMICRNADSDGWRTGMQAILDTEAGGPVPAEAERRAKLTAAFNRGYRSFASVYTACTPQAVASDKKYRAEGATLASEITSLYGN